ncbi:MAG: hypothetical protein R3E08_00335 [Thiotrichaceae bacterium]
MNWHVRQVSYHRARAGTRPAPDSATFVGSGKLAELAELVKANDIEVVLFNHTLTPESRNAILKKP